MPLLGPERVEVEEVEFSDGEWDVGVASGVGQEGSKALVEGREVTATDQVKTLLARGVERENIGDDEVAVVKVGC